MDGTDGYFASYARPGIHLDMLQDIERTTIYMKAIEYNRSTFEGKVVLDVGCGTGILSLFAARAGARKVYAVDAAPIARCARAIVARNGYSDVVTVIEGRVEDVELPERADVLVSEWMGYFLFFENMLASVVAARDRLLRRDGGARVLPSRARLFLCGAYDPEGRARGAEFWADVYGFDFAPMRDAQLREAHVDTLTVAHVFTSSAAIADIDVATVAATDLREIRAEFALDVRRPARLDAFAAFFTVDFDGLEQKFTLSTSYDAPQTHWNQTIFYIDEPVMLDPPARITGTSVIRHTPENPRAIELELVWSCGPEDSIHRQSFVLS